MPRMDDRKLHNPETLAIHSDRHRSSTTAVAPPIWQTSTFFGNSAEEFLDMAGSPMHERFYSRYGNPTLSHATDVLASLEGAERAILFSSGMGAITTAVLSFVSAGDHVVAQSNHYAGTNALLEKHLPRFGITRTRVDEQDAGAFERAITPQTKIILLESPTNPMMRLTDLKAVTSIARERGIVTMIDNTFATPINQRPIEFGVDLVMHSATKYLGGHSDLLAGAVVGPTNLVQQVWETSLVFGATLNAFDGWLLLRGMRTLPLRVAQHNRNALAVAKALEAHPAVRRVNYPGLESHPQHELARRQMDGFGGMLSVEVEGGAVGAERFIAGLKMAYRAGSLGGVESLVSHPAAMWVHSYTEEELAAIGIAPGLVRLSVGIETTEDLVADVIQAMDGVAAGKAVAESV